MNVESKLLEVFLHVFPDRVSEPPKPDDIVFGRDSIYGLESMDTLRFASALLPVYGDKVYDIRIEDVTSLASLSRQLQ